MKLEEEEAERVVVLEGMQMAKKTSLVNKARPTHVNSQMLRQHSWSLYDSAPVESLR